MIYKFIPNNERLIIAHCIKPECQIEVIHLQKAALWAQVASMDSVFDFKKYRSPTDNTLYMLLVDDDTDVDDDNIKKYRTIIDKAWKWLLHGYLLPGNPLPTPPRYIQHIPNNESDLFSAEDGYIYHRGSPVFRVPIAALGELNIMDELEFNEQYTPAELMELPRLMRELGDWVALNLY